MLTVDQVADYFIYRARDMGEAITALKVQKLVYYAQAWHLALNDSRLIEARFEAWVHGPVCRPLYERFKGYGWRPIDEDIVFPEIDGNDLAFLDEVWEAYGDINAVALERLTHHEDPWLSARGEIPPDAPSTSVIDDDLMKRYYRTKLSVAAVGPS